MSGDVCVHANLLAGWSVHNTDALQRCNAMQSLPAVDREKVTDQPVIDSVRWYLFSAV